MNSKKLKLFASILFFGLIILVVYYKNIQGSPSPRYFTSDRYIIIGGKPFFPIGLYSVNPLKRWDPPNAFEEIKEAGFNSVHTYENESEYLQEYVKKAESVGLKVLIYPGSRMEKPEFNINDVKNTVANLAKSPAILSWYLSEEPDAANIDPKQIKEERDLISNLDPGRATSIIISDRSRYKNYANYSDIFMIERYPVPKQSIVDVAESLDMARKAVKDKIPVWAVLQAFGYQNDKNKGWDWGREPTLQEMKAMTWLAIAKGVRGIFYFTYHGSQYFIKDSPDHWEGLKAIAGELRSVYPLLVAPEVKSGLSRVSVSDSNKSSFFWTVREVNEGNLLIPAGTYLIAINGDTNPGRATFNFNNRDIGNVKVVSEERVLQTAKGSFSDSFAPYEVHIYGLAPIH